MAPASLNRHRARLQVLLVRGRQMRPAARIPHAMRKERRVSGGRAQHKVELGISISVSCAPSSQARFNARQDGVGGAREEGPVAGPYWVRNAAPVLAHHRGAPHLRMPRQSWRALLVLAVQHPSLPGVHMALAPRTASACTVMFAIH